MVVLAENKFGSTVSEIHVIRHAGSQPDERSTAPRSAKHKQSEHKLEQQPPTHRAPYHLNIAKQNRRDCKVRISLDLHAFYRNDMLAYSQGKCNGWVWRDGSGEWEGEGGND